MMIAPGSEALLISGLPFSLKSARPEPACANPGTFIVEDAMDEKKSPCLDCIIHKLRLDKEDPKYPCINCEARFLYADSVMGMPSRDIDGQLYTIDPGVLIKADL